MKNKIDLPQNICILITSKEEEEAVLKRFKELKVSKYISQFNPDGDSYPHLKYLDIGKFITEHTHTASSFLSEYGTEEQPKKWAILRTPENAEMVNEYSNHNLGYYVKYEWDTGIYFHFPKHQNIHGHTFLASGYTLITDEQFKRIAGIKSEPEKPKSILTEELKRHAVTSSLNDGPEEKYKVGQWLYFKDIYGEWEQIARFDSYKEDGRIESKERYCIEKSGNVTIYNTSFEDRAVSIATPDQIQSILSKIAEWKRIKAGVYINNPFSHTQHVIPEKSRMKEDNGFVYDKIDDMLFLNGWCVYRQGVWATIVEKPAEAHNYATALQSSSSGVARMDYHSPMKSKEVKEIETEEEIPHLTPATIGSYPLPISFNWSNVSSNQQVIELLKIREGIESIIRRIDPDALVNYELESLKIEKEAGK